MEDLKKKFLRNKQYLAHGLIAEAQECGAESHTQIIEAMGMLHQGLRRQDVRSRITQRQRTSSESYESPEKKKPREAERSETKGSRKPSAPESKQPPDELKMVPAMNGVNDFLLQYLDTIPDYKLSLLSHAQKAHYEKNFPLTPSAHSRSNKKQDPRVEPGKKN